MEAARGEVRRRVWSLAGEHSPAAGISAASPLVIDVDATLVEAHSAKEGAAPTFKGGFGYHPLTAWFDHGPDGAGSASNCLSIEFPLNRPHRPGGLASSFR